MEPPPGNSPNAADLNQSAANCGMLPERFTSQPNFFAPLATKRLCHKARFPKPRSAVSCAMVELVGQGHAALRADFIRGGRFAQTNPVRGLRARRNIIKRPFRDRHMNRDRVLARLETFEGSVPYMYRCTGGEVTAGIGHAIFTPLDAVKLNWQIHGRPAAPAEVTADFEKVEAAPKGLLAPHYQPLTECRLADDYVLRLALEDIATREAALIAAFSAWASFPGPVQEALFDMGFNLGIGGLRKFVKMLAAVDARNWEAAAAESLRQGVSAARNQETASLFRQALTT
jgi:GH24 family phage-related lysozyme (muramidase)